MTGRLLRIALLAAGLVGSTVLAQVPVGTPLPAPPAQTAQMATGTPELLFDQGKRSFDAFTYDQAVPVFDRLIALLTAGGQVQRPDLLVQAYELRARSRFALGDPAGTEQDFSALLVIKADFKLSAGVSPRVVTVFNSVRRLTIGQITASMTPPGEVQIDGRPYALQSDPQPIDLPAGEHQVNATRPGYRPVTQRFTVTAGDISPLTLTLERVSATLTIVSVPDGVEVTVDGTSRGQTQGGTGPTESSAPFLVNDLSTGSHRLQLHRDCYKDLERTITVEKPDDLQAGPLRLTPALANVRILMAEPGGAVFLDRAARGTAPAEFTVCEGPHAIEVKGPKGRFVDRRDWKTGDNAVLEVELRSAFPIVAVKSVSGMTVDQLRANVERALATSKHVLVYSPTAAELDAAVRGENIPADWLGVDSVDTSQTAPRIPREVKRDLGRSLARKLEVQGVAAIAAGPDPYTVTVSLLAAGSGDPDVITINMADAASQARGAALLGAPLPPIVGPSIETSVVDLTGVQGAVVVRTGGVGAKAGLAAGDVIVGAGGTPIASVAELRAKISAVRPPAAPLSLDVKGPGGTPRKVDVTVTTAPDTIPLRDPGLLYNRALVELGDAVRTAVTPLEKATAHLNLAIVHMRLGNWEEAQTELKDAQLPDGAGVSAGTVAYLTGLCLDSVGRTADARVAFTKAAAAPLARLANDGPLIAPLAQQKLQRPR
jgi:hypothetical protein